MPGTAFNSAQRKGLFSARNERKLHDLSGLAVLAEMPV